MRLWEGLQHAVDNGFIPFVLAAGERRGVKVNLSQIINALVIAGITAVATSFATVKVIENELQNQKELIQDARQQMRELRNRVDNYHMQRGQQ